MEKIDEIAPSAYEMNVSLALTWLYSAATVFFNRRCRLTPLAAV